MKLLSWVLVTMILLAMKSTGSSFIRNGEDAGAFSSEYAITTTVPTVSVRFYGESQCPYCRKFVRETWHDIWSDDELRKYIDYNFVPWGNAYFGTDACGHGPYSSKERACFYEKCLGSTRSLDDDACFGGEPVYQHSEKEGQVDIYETCILTDVGLEAGVEFTYCAEGDIMDKEELTAQKLMEICVPEGVDPDSVQACLGSRGRQLEIENAKQTPDHPGVPFVLIDHASVDNPFEDTKTVICQHLHQKGVNPVSCTSVPFEGTGSEKSLDAQC